MKIPVKDIESFIVNVPKEIRAVLLYGPDHGLIKLRVNAIRESRFLAGELKYEQVKTRPSLILDSLNSQSLFGEKLDKERLVLIECTGIGLVDPILSFMKAKNYQGLVVFYAGELGTDSGLRRFFEATPFAAAIPCYVDDQASVIRLIQQIFRQNKITCDGGLIPLITNYISLGDRALILSEVEKILLFLGNKKQHITQADLIDYLQPQGEVSFEKLCYKFSLRQVNDIDLLLNSLRNEGHNIVSIARMLIRHFNRLYQVRCLIEQGRTEQQALDSLVPPVFFKQTNDFITSLKQWTKEQLFLMLKNLNSIELAAKQAPIVDNMMLKNLALQSSFRKA